MADLNVGIVGLGWVAGAHIETFKALPGANVTAICSRRKHDEGALAERYGTPLKAYTDYDAMLADDSLDVIDICTPHPFHAEQAIKAAQAGKHLIIEKPIALTWEDAKAIKKAVDKAGVQVCVCFECRFAGQFTLIRSLIDKGLLGKLHYGEVDYFHGIGPWAGQYTWNVKKNMGGSSLLTAGCHAMDGLLMFMDGKVAEVTSMSTPSASKPFQKYEYDTTAATLLRFDDGRVAKVTSCIDCHQPYYLHIHLVGSEGAVLDDQFYSNKLPGMNKDKWSKLATSLIESGDVADHPYYPQFDAFIRAARRGKPMPWTDLDSALETHRVCFAADLSAKEKRAVRMSELR